MSDHVTRELSSIRFSSMKPEVEVSEDGVFELRLKTAGSDSSEVLFAPSRDVRLACRCAECTNEFTGKSRLKSWKIPEGVGPLSLSQTGNYALTIEWSDGHESILAFETLEDICRRYMESKQSGTNCRLLSQLDW